MALSTDGGRSAMLSPDEAFSALGNETRIRILQTLGEADGPLSFTDLRTRVGLRHGGQFTYHLDKLAGHFVDETNEGYELRQAGQRVVQAILSGAVTEAPVLEPTRIEESCHYCGAPIEVSFFEEKVEFYCTGCEGLFGETNKGRSPEAAEYGYLGYASLPPAGLQGRTPTEVAEAAWIWGGLDVMATSSGVCPRCSAPIEWSVSVCEAHDDTEGLCEECDHHYAVNLHHQCTNCIYGGKGMIGLRLMANTELLAFLTAHGINSLTDIEWVSNDYDEEVISTDPFKARFTYTVGNDELTLTLDDDLNVVEVIR